MTAPKSAKWHPLKTAFMGGLLPVIAFTIIEEIYGTLAGLLAGMAFGFFEILWELKTDGKVQTLTWAGNALILVLGGISLLTNEGIWFKLQPALIEGVCAVGLVGSIALQKPLLWGMVQKQQKQMGVSLESLPPEAIEKIQRSLRGITLRMGLFLGIHAALATWAAFHWSTAAWALLKGVGFTVSLLIYLGLEGLAMRLQARPKPTTPVA